MIVSDEWQARMLDLFKGDLPLISEMIRATEGPIIGYPIYDISTQPIWHKGPVVLVGDAIHAISPGAGQGASLLQALRQPGSTRLGLLVQGGLGRAHGVRGAFGHARRNSIELQPTVSCMANSGTRSAGDGAAKHFVAQRDRPFAAAQGDTVGPWSETLRCGSELALNAREWGDNCDASCSQQGRGPRSRPRRVTSRQQPKPQPRIQ